MRNKHSLNHNPIFISIRLEITSPPLACIVDSLVRVSRRDGLGKMMQTIISIVNTTLHNTSLSVKMISHFTSPKEYIVVVPQQLLEAQMLIQHKFPFSTYLQAFSALLTLFTEYFSVFPHGTYALSLSPHIFNFWASLRPVALYYQRARLNVKIPNISLQWFQVFHSKFKLLSREFSIINFDGHIRLHYNMHN